MNVEGFKAEFRRVMRDSIAPYLWADEEIVTYLNDAENEAAERALLLEDKATAEVCSIALAAGQGDYTLHESVLKVERLTFRGRALAETSVEQLDAEESNWESRNGDPRRYICVQNFGLRMVPKPVTVENIALTVYRLPLVPMAGDTDEPEIPARLHMRLMPWVYRCAHLKDDADTFNPQAASVQEGIFEASFGKRPDANVQRKQRDKRPARVRFQW